MPSGLPTIDNGHHFNDGLASLNPPSGYLLDMAPLQQIWPRVYPTTLGQGHGHDIDREHRLRYAFYMINGYRLPPPPTRGYRKHEPQPPSPLCQISTTKSTSNATPPILMTPSFITAHAQANVDFSSALHEALQNVQISNTQETGSFTILSTFGPIRVLFTTLVLPRPPTASLSSPSQQEARLALLGAHPFFDVDKRRAKLQEIIRNYTGFRQELQHRLEREKEHHLEDIIARIAPGPQDAGYRAPLASHAENIDDIEDTEDTDIIDEDVVDESSSLPIQET